MPALSPTISPSEIALSIVAPAHNEEANLRSLVAEIHAAISPLSIAHEIVIVDDGSTDSTPHLLRDLLCEYGQLRALRMQRTPPGRGHGQSAAFHAAFRAARGKVIAVLDADLQNDPADIPAMLEVMSRTGADLVQGDRSHARADNVVRKASSWVGRFFRRTLLSDGIRDTGCSLRLMRREVALAIPLEFRGMHRFIPVTARSLGYQVVEVQVNHRPRIAGEAKYGIMNRALPSLYDCLAVRWMMKRRRPTHALPLAREAGDEAQAMVVEYPRQTRVESGALRRHPAAATAQR